MVAAGEGALQSTVRWRLVDGIGVSSGCGAQVLWVGLAGRQWGQRHLRGGCA